MTKKIKEFQKYKNRGAYHWDQISFNPIKRNIFVIDRYTNIIKLLKNEIGCIKNKRILDIGCGDGVLSYLLYKEGAKISGIDYSDIAINLAKQKTKNYNIDFRQGNAYKLMYNDNTFDIVVSSDVIEHLDNVNKYLSKINRVVVQNGIVIISTSIRYTEYPLDKEHIIEWFPTEFKKIIEQKFKNSKYFYSHPLVLEELYQAKYFGKQWGRVIFNFISFIFNPFKGFNSRFKYQVLQYSVSKVEK